MLNNIPLGRGLREAMKLIKAGDLRGATMTIQRQLRGETLPESQPPPSQPPRTEEAIFVPPEAKAPGTGKARFITGTHESEAGARRYKLFIPAGYHGQPLPLIVMLHGCTQTPTDFATGTRMNDMAEERECFVVYPEQPRSANHSLCWNWFNTADQRRDTGEPGILVGLVRELMASYAVDQSRIYVAGLSAGGAMAVILGRTHPELFAAVGVHSGLPFGAAHDLPSALMAMRGSPGPGATQAAHPMPTIVFHGDRDNTVHPDNGDHVAIQAAGPCTCDVTDEEARSEPGDRTFSRKIFKDEDGSVVVESWLIHGGSHKWSGGDPRGSHTDAAGPDASREMVRFFLERSRH